MLDAAVVAALALVQAVLGDWRIVRCLATFTGAVEEVTDSPFGSALTNRTMDGAHFPAILAARPTLDGGDKAATAAMMMDNERRLMILPLFAPRMVDFGWPLARCVDRPKRCAHMAPAVAKGL